MRLARFTPVLLGLSLLGGSPAMAGDAVPVMSTTKASEGPNWFAKTTIVNDSPYVVTYDYGWGDGDYEYSITLKPGESWNHWWTYSYANEDSSPWFYIRIDGDSGDYRLRSFAEPNTDGDGKVYYIRFDRDQEQFVLFAKLYQD